MEDGVTKEDLRQFGMLLIGNIRKMLEGSPEEKNREREWLKSRQVRKQLDISAGSLQNLRITGKVRYKKVLGSYYYNSEDITNLFREGSDDTKAGTGKIT